MDSENRISRREMIRNIGVVGAAAWAAPALTSLPAAASTANACKKYPRGCQPFQGCGCQPLKECSSSNPHCACFHAINDGKVRRKSQCFDLSAGGYCDNYRSCQNKKDCRKGELCMTSCCDLYGEGPLCVPICTKQGAAGAPRKRLKRDGRATLFR
jgi:hypothetical protein